MKTCSGCNLTLPFENFYKRGPNGYQHRCKSCKLQYEHDNKEKMTAHREEWRKTKYPPKPKKDRKRIVGRLEKKCWNCETLKPIHDFHKNKTINDGHSTECKSCKKVLDKEYKESCGPELAIKLNEAKKKARKENPEHYRTKGRIYANTRRAYKIQGSLNNEFKKEIEDIYFNCPKDYHVDHIVPLNNPIVCGLHVPWNLQYLTKEENLKKGNKLCLDQ